MKSLIKIPNPAIQISFLETSLSRFQYIHIIISIKLNSNKITTTNKK